MLELGAAAAVEHEKLGQALARLGCSRVYYHGHHAADVRLGWETSGERGRFMECKTPDDFVSGWRKGAEDGGVVLFKGSRAGKMETYLEALRTELSA
jgi:UDP-N-acetylmuramoyl-tripeptide--D-alanyl-D-alanine ligase